MNLIFDFDGTICDNFDIVYILATELLQKEGGVTISANEARGKGTKKLISESRIPKYKIPKLLLTARKRIAHEIPNLKPFKTLPTVIKELSKKHKLGIITSNSEENVTIFLKNHKLLQYFSFIRSEIDLFGKGKKLKKVIFKYNLKPEETIYIGDETRDIEAAKYADTKSVAVTWGYESEKLLKGQNSDYIAEKPQDLLKIFKFSS
ncbi:hypothetical protein A2714_05230 [Candidatus Woesebacteria bacterium RIFCSPHIGHO2_01_FULL_38_9]|uniref:Carotenoid oxygenase n=2 Tax=Candidatus Woeseibacteriota TaxID=1752722 RepID=A0A1F7XZ00_9BACT|nr:MAG: hypothetical protein A2714_05230 [Candidatus Woesebacteria bacterium RIFCSPHIGHO2_01_FULL_38_9]OGM58649.1 MAG: hypothetical protein A3A75_01315 [Candidatus Woesebacteria bacterium RIFCSPLOWO2_01_FULL_39_10]